MEARLSSLRTRTVNCRLLAYNPATPFDCRCIVTSRSPCSIFAMSKIRSLPDSAVIIVDGGYVLRRAEIADAPLIADLVDIAWGGDLYKELSKAGHGTDARAFAISEVRAPESHMSWTNTIVICEEKKASSVVGIATMFNPMDLKEKGVAVSPIGFEKLDILIDSAMKRYEGSGYMYLAHLAVFKEHRGKKLSKVLISAFAAEQSARQLPARNLASLDSSVRANSIYRAAGFEKNELVVNFEGSGDMFWFEATD